MKKYMVIALCLVLCVALLSCGKKKQEAPKQEQEMAPMADIMDIFTSDGRFTTLLTAIDAAGLADTLRSPGPFTVFAPTDSAFAKLPPGTVESLLADVPTLKNILLFHVAPGKMMASDMATMKKAATALGDSVSIMVMPDGKIMVNDANIVESDIEAKNGVIQVIDKVLMPPKK
jgi:uncharacterized surface protein with fasciclin (FAS1) repeats